MEQAIDRSTSIARTQEISERRLVLGELFSRHRRELLDLAEHRLDRRLRTRLDAEDILQESFLEAVRRWGGARFPASAPSLVWVKSLVVQKLIELRRRHLAAKRDVRREVGDGGRAMRLEVEGESFDVPDPAADSPLEIVLRRETRARVASLLRQVPPADRRLLVLRVLIGLRFADIAGRLGTAPPATRKRYQRALKRLEGALARPTPQASNGKWRRPSRTV